MAKYLFLLGMYYPRSSANGVCCKNIVDALIRNGDEVTCIVNGDITRPKEEIIDGAHVIRVRPRLNYCMLEWCNYHKSAKIVGLVKASAALFNKVQLFIMSPWWPRISPMYTKRFYKTAKELISKENYSAIISVYTPIDTLYAGFLLKKEFPAIRFIPYYLDALAGGWGPSMWSKSKIDGRTRNLEDKIDAVADFAISMQSSAAYHSTHPLPSADKIIRHYLDVPTFIPEKTSSHVTDNQIQDATIKAVYCGSIHFPDRDPRQLMNHFVPICKNHDVELIFIGSNNCPDIFREYAKKTDNKIKTIGQLSHEEAMKQLEAADILVNLGSSNPNTVTCKIFEYMQFRKPIISTFSISNEPSIPYLQKYANCFLLNENTDIDFESYNKELSHFILNHRPAEDADYSRIFYKNTPQAFIDILENNF